MAVDSEVAGLPEFARAAWCTQFIPTFYHYIGTRQLGWKICELGEEVKVVQLVFDIVFPGNSYKVKKGCPIYVTVCGRAHLPNFELTPIVFRRWLGSVTSDT